ncbi:MAG: hypothetical protein ACW96M_07920 [Candidatus Thorarchaeota archaeon]|jgi:hypothetical protein
MSTSNANNESFEPTMTISVYGGKKNEVKESIERNLELTDESFYQTWMSVNVMKQLAFLFEGGVESSGGIIEMIIMFVFIAIILAAFAFWQVVIFMVVLLVLALFSGGAALKFVRGTFIEADHSKIDLTKLDNFVKEQLKAGRFVKVDSLPVSDKLGETTKDASQATTVFRRGIYIAMVVVTLLLVVEVAYYILMNHWLSGLDPVTGPQEIIVLYCFGLAFLLGILIMDLGVLMRRSLSKSLE